MKNIVRGILAMGVLCLSATCDYMRTYKIGFVDRWGHDWSFSVSTGDEAFPLPVKNDEGFKK